MDTRRRRSTLIAGPAREAHREVAASRLARKSYAWVFAGWAFTLAGWIFLTIAWNAAPASTLQLVAMAAAVASGAGALAICVRHKPARTDYETP